MINFNKGQNYNIHLDPDNSPLRDSNSTWLIYLRWLALLNQLVWICVANSSKHLENIAVSLSVFPSVGVLLYENTIFYFRKDEMFLNAVGWTIVRSLVILFTTISTFIWFSEPNELLLLLVSVWVILVVYIFIEMLISCVHNDKCPNMCVQRDYYQI